MRSVVICPACPRLPSTKRLAPRSVLLVLALLSAVFVLQACGPNAAAFNADRLAELRRRATFELSCAEPIELSPLAYGWSGGSTDIVTSYGASGCGHRTVYLLTPYANQWVANSSGGESPTAEPVDGPVPPPG